MICLNVLFPKTWVGHGTEGEVVAFFSVRMWKCEFEFERQSDYFLWWWPVRSSYCVKCGYDTSDDRFWELCRRQGVPKVKVQYHGNSLSWCLPPQSVFVSLHFSWKQKNIAFFIVFGLRWSGDILCAYFFFFFFSFFSLVTLFGGESMGHIIA